MKIYEIEILNEKAKKRKDGIYSYHSYLWVCKDNKFVYFSDYYGQVHQRAGNFNVCVGEIKRQDIRTYLKKLLKEN